MSFTQRKTTVSLSGNTDEITLTSGQTVIHLTITTVSNSVISVTGDDIGGRQLIENADYTVNNDKKITLIQSFPAGTVLISRDVTQT